MDWADCQLDQPLPSLCGDARRVHPVSRRQTQKYARRDCLPLLAAIKKCECDTCLNPQSHYGIFSLVIQCKEDPLISLPGQILVQFLLQGSTLLFSSLKAAVECTLLVLCVSSFWTCTPPWSAGFFVCQPVFHKSEPPAQTASHSADLTLADFCHWSCHRMAPSIGVEVA